MSFDSQSTCVLATAVLRAQAKLTFLATMSQSSWGIRYLASSCCASGCAGGFEAVGDRDGAAGMSASSELAFESSLLDMTVNFCTDPGNYELLGTRREFATRCETMKSSFDSREQRPVFRYAESTPPS